MLQTPKIITRPEWGALPPTSHFPANAAKGLCIHHWASPNRTPYPDIQAEIAWGKNAMRIMQKFHMEENGWADIGEHFAITRGGVILEGRSGSLERARNGQVVKAAHAGNTAGNLYFFGVNLEGNYSLTDDLPDVLRASLVGLCAWLCYWGNLQTHSLLGHKDFTKTTCPGRLYMILDGIRQDVEGFMDRIVASKDVKRDAKLSG